MSFLRPILVSFCGAALAVTGLAVWLLATPAGTRTAWSWIQSQTAPQLTAAAIAGTFWTGIELRGFQYADTTMRLDIDELAVALDFPALLQRRVVVETLRLGAVRYQTPGAGEPGEPGEAFDPEEVLPSPALLAGFLVRQVHIDALSVAELTLDSVDGRLGLLYDTAENAWSLDNALSARLRYRKLEGHLHLTLSGDLDAPDLRLEGASNAGDPVLHATLRAPFREADLALELEIARLDPEILSGQALGIYRLSASATGTLTEVRGQLHVKQTTASPDQPVEELELRFASAPGRVAFTEVQAMRRGHRFLTGRLDLDYEPRLKAAGAFSVTDLNLRDFRTDLTPTVINGEITLDAASAGAADPAPGARIGLDLKDGKKWRLRGSLIGDAQRVQIPELRFNAPRGNVAVTGALDLGQTRNFAFDVQGEGFDPGALTDRLKGNLSFVAKAEGRIAPLAVTAGLNFREGSRLQGALLGGSLSLDLRGTDWVLGSGRLMWGKGRITLSGERNDVKVDFAELDPGLLLPELQAAVSGQLRVRIEDKQTAFELEARVPDLRYRDIKASGIAASAKGTLDNPLDTQFSAMLARIERAGGRESVTRLSLSGTAAEHQLTAAARLDPVELELSLDGGYRAPTYSARLTRLALDLPRTLNLELAHAAPLSVSPGRIDIGPLRLQPRQQANDNIYLEFSAALDLERQRLQTEGALRSFDVAWLKRLVPGPSPSGNVTADWDLTYDDSEAPLRGELTLGIRQLTLPSPEAGMPALQVSEIVLDTRAQGERVELTVAMDQSEDNRMRARGTLAGFPPLHRLRADPGVLAALAVAGNIEVQVRDLSLLAAAAPAVRIDSGIINAQVGLTGRIENPDVKGEVVLADFAFGVTEYGFDGRIPELVLALDKSEIAIASFLLTTPPSGGELRARGAVSLRPGEIGNFRIELDGTRLQLTGKQDLQLVVSPELKVNGTLRALTVGGRVVVERALLAMVPESEGVALSPDVVVLGEEAPGPTAPEKKGPGGIDLRVRIEIPDSFRLRYAGADLTLGGDVSIALSGRGVPLGSGKLYVVTDKAAVRHVYRAYGQNLTIKRGTILFAETPLDNPALDILAVRTVSVGEVGVDVRGTVQRPEIALESQPPMPDSEILSWLVLGRPQSQAGAALGPLLLGAGSSLLGGSGGSLTEKAQDLLGLDELDIGTEGESGAGFVTLGKKLGERLYLSYEQGVLAAGSKVKATYVLTPVWSIIAESGLASSSAEIQYKKRF